MCETRDAAAWARLAAVKTFYKRICIARVANYSVIGRCAGAHESEYTTRRAHEAT